MFAVIDSPSRPLTADSEVAGLLLAAAACWLLVHTAGWALYVRLRYPRREWLVRLLDPASYPAVSLATAIHAAGLHRLRRSSTSPRSTRRSLDLGQPITSPRGEYRPIKRRGRGDISDVYQAEGPGGTCTLKVAWDRGMAGRLLHEQDVVKTLRGNRRATNYLPYLPRPLETFHVAGVAVSAIEHREGLVSAIEIRRRVGDEVHGRHVAWMFNRTLEVLGFVHRAGWVHGAVLPPHLLFHPDDHAMQLIGWTHACRSGTPLTVVSRQYKHWYPPECHRRQPATPATDLFLAAKSMLWLSAASSDSPGSLAEPIRQLLIGCLAPCPDDRPGDAWALHAQFRELLEEIYGPPKFCRLTLSSHQEKRNGYHTMV